MNKSVNYLSNDSPNEYDCFPPILRDNLSRSYGETKVAARKRCPFVLFRLYKYYIVGGFYYAITSKRDNSGEICPNE